MITRRNFIKRAVAGTAMLSFGGVLPEFSAKSYANIVGANDRIQIGCIGVNSRGAALARNFAKQENCIIKHICDVDSRALNKCIAEVSKISNTTPKGYKDLRLLLEKKDLDAVVIATPDHWHALTTIHACQAGKDVYCQKPLAYTIAEGLAMVKAVRDNKRVLQVGSQQRSSEEFQKAIELVRNGAIGHVEKIYARVGAPPKPLDLPEMPVPGNLNFNQWMGPLNDPKVHYHPDLCPPISLDPEQNEQLWGAWRWYQETGNGFTADWGAHMFDIAQAAIGMDGSGPVEFTPAGYNGQKYASMKYANGIVMTEQPYREDNENAQGIQFIGDKGWLKVARGYIECSDPSLLKAKKKEVGKGEYEVSSPHMQNFIDCVRSRENPIAPVEVGCSTNTLCCLANISRELNRPVKWDPATLSFVNDKEAAAHRLYWYQYRNPYTLPYWK